MNNNWIFEYISQYVIITNKSHFSLQLDDPEITGWS